MPIGWTIYASGKLKLDNALDPWPVPEDEVFGHLSSPLKREPETWGDDYCANEYDSPAHC